MSGKKDNITENVNEIEKTENSMEIQKKVIDTTASNLSKIGDNINNTIDGFLEENKVLYEKNIKTMNEYQDKLLKVAKDVSNVYVELQKKMINTYQSEYNKFFNAIPKSSFENLKNPETYSEIFNTFNKNIIDSSIATTNATNEILLSGLENFSKSSEIAQKWYNDSIQNYFDYSRKIGKLYSR